MLNSSKRFICCIFKGLIYHLWWVYEFLLWNILNHCCIGKSNEVNLVFFWKISSTLDFKIFNISFLITDHAFAFVFREVMKTTPATDGTVTKRKASKYMSLSILLLSSLISNSAQHECIWSNGDISGKNFLDHFSPYGWLPWGYLFNGDTWHCHCISLA